jgi:DNA-binding beta-propeller fold protein YncE
MSNRIRILLLALTMGLATLTPVASASAHTHGSRRQHARAEHFRAIARRDRAILARSSHLRPFGSAAARWSGVLSDQVSLSSLSASTGPFGFRSALVASAPVGNLPAAVAVNLATHTIYVANGFGSNGPSEGGNTVSVIDARHCNAQDVSRCKGPWPTITVGNLPSGIAIDVRTDTVYVSNFGDDTVSVFNGATCNARDHSGCGQTPATVPVGSGPIGIFADDANHTVYVANFNDVTVSMINSATCNATGLASCPTSAPPTVTVAGGPGDVDVNQITHTVYVANLTGLSAFNADTCNATELSGCATIGQASVPQCNSAYFPWCGPFTAKVDPANNTIYESDGTTTVYVFDGRSCNATELAECSTDAPGAVTPFPEPGFEADVWVAVDTALHSVYVTYQKDDALIVIDANTCNGSHLAACATLDPPEIHTGADPEFVALDPHTQTLYTANEVDNDISVIDASLCDAQTTSGCRQRVPEAPIIRAGGLAADPAVATTYVATGATAVAVINTNDCKAFHASGCSATPPTVTVGANPAAVAIDPVTHTVYVADAGSASTGTVSVFDDRACNATNQTGCTTVSTLQVPGGNPDAVAVNPVTDTIYVATITGSGPDLISVFNGATCNSSNTGDCEQTPATVPVGSSDNGSSLELAINPATNTIYAANVFDLQAPPPFLGNSVYMINGATCDAANLGCGQTPATITLAPNPPVGSNPFGIAVDQATDTIYTANIADGEHPGTVSVINGAICNGNDAHGCGQTPATAAAGFGADGIAIDQLTNQVYVTNQEDTSVTTINGATCNGTNATSCSDTRTEATVGDYPGPISVDAFVGTAYVADIEGVSVIALGH